MNHNVGSADRLVRIVAGIGLIGFGVLDSTSLRWLGVVGVVLVLTGFVRFCPAYWLLRIRTSR